MLLTVLDLRPWRCRSCDLRFYGWKVALPHTFYAHCPKCGNFDLQGIARDRVEEGSLNVLKRLLLFPAYRCPPCRERFFSLLLYRRIVPLADPRPAKETPSEQQIHNS